MKNILLNLGFICIMSISYMLLNFLYIKAPEKVKFFVVAIGSSLITMMGWTINNIMIRR